MKSCLLICSINSIHFKSTFKFIKSNIFALGRNRVNFFILPNGDLKAIASCWLTTLTSDVKRPFLNLTKSYNSVDYPKYDNYDAININRSELVPCDYYGAMGVPVTFLFKYNPNQFEIIDCINRHSCLYGSINDGKYLNMVNGKPTYSRIIIKRR